MFSELKSPIRVKYLRNRVRAARLCGEYRSRIETGHLQQFIGVMDFEPSHRELEYGATSPSPIRQPG
jgi:hypothetical protein